MDYAGAYCVAAPNDDYVYAQEIRIPATVNIDGVEYPVISINSNTFFRNKTVKRIVLGENVKYISSGAFYESEIEEIILNNKLESIGDFAFYNCPRLNKIEFTEKSCYIGTSAFKNSAIKELYFKGTIGNKFGAFDCPDLETIVFYEGVGGFQENAFGSRKVLKLEIPGSMNLNSNVFSGLLNLKSVTLLPVTGNRSRIKAKASAFPRVTSLEEFICLDPEPPVIDENMMSAEQYAGCTLKVPAGCRDAYRAATGWCRFVNITELAGVDDIESDDATVVSTDYYDLMGRRISSPVSGTVVIEKSVMSDGTVRVTKSTR